MLSTSSRPGQRLLLDTLRRYAEEESKAVAIRQTTSIGGQSSSILLTYAELVGCIDHLSCWLHDNFSPDNVDDKHYTIAYLGPNDLRTLLLPIAAAQCGLVVLLLSPRNNLQTHLHLVGSSNCNALMVDEMFANVNVGCKQQIIVPTLDAVLCEGKCWSHRLSEPQDSWEAASDRTIVLLHTSGSTGPPKTINITHRVLSTVDIQREVTDSNGNLCQLACMAKEAKTVYITFPFFHIAGFHLTCYFLFSGLEVILGAPKQPASISAVHKIFNSLRPDVALLPPAILDELVSEAASIPTIEWPKILFYGGGQIQEDTGDYLVQKTRLFNGIGSTEVGSICLMPLEPENWKYFEFCVENGITWSPLDEQSQQFEMCITRQSNFEYMQAVFASLPYLSEWRTKDVYRKHPNRAATWEYVGRADDMIVLSTGENLNPLVLEAALPRAIKGVKSALVVGSGKFCPLLLVEPYEKSKSSDLDGCDLVVRISSYLETEGMRLLSRDAQILPGAVIVGSDDKPFCRSAKGSIHRRLTQELYQEEIAATYTDLKFNPQLNDWKLDLTALEPSLLVCFQRVLDHQALQVDQDLFHAGLDSRQAQMAAVCIQRALKTSLPNANRVVGAGILYSNPTVRSLAQQLAGVSAPNASSSLSQVEQFDQMVKDSLQRYEREVMPILAKTDIPRCVSSVSGNTVLLTGSSGFLGAYLLRALVARPEIKSIVCLDRRNPRRGQQFENPKIKRYEGSLHKPNFDLSDEDYQMLIRNVSCVIHSQWPVNFVQPLKFFEPNVQGVIHLLRFCAQLEAKQSPMIFLSSIATVQNWDNQGQLVPETELNDPRHCQTGYGLSKLLASVVIEHAAKHGQTPLMIARVGQIAGPCSVQSKHETLTPWPTRDWFPTLLRISKAIGAIPENLGRATRIDWIPVDTLSEILVDLSLLVIGSDVSSFQAGLVPRNASRYLHLVNPQACSYKDLLEYLSTSLSKQNNNRCMVVPFSEWLQKLQSQLQSASPSATEKTQPVLNDNLLLPFFTDLAESSSAAPVILDTGTTLNFLPRMRELQAINKQWMGEWLDQWHL